MIKTNIFTYIYSMPLNVVITLKGFLKCHKKYSSMVRMRLKLNLHYYLIMNWKILNLSLSLGRI